MNILEFFHKIDLLRMWLRLVIISIPKKLPLLIILILSLRKIYPNFYNFMLNSRKPKTYSQAIINKTNYSNQKALIWILLNDLPGNKKCKFFRSFMILEESKRSMKFLRDKTSKRKLTIWILRLLASEKSLESTSKMEKSPLWEYQKLTVFIHWIKLRNLKSWSIIERFYLMRNNFWKF